MNLPINPPVLPMLAKRIDTLPTGSGWVYEPTWDGFRTLVFCHEKEVLLQSRDEKSLNRYFQSCSSLCLSPRRRDCGLAHRRTRFGCASASYPSGRIEVKFLSEQTPASIVFFDLLAEGNHDRREKEFGQRRDKLVSILSDVAPPVHITPATDQLAIARDWFRRFEGAGFDGVVAKAKDSVYESDKRTMLKIKHERDCDCVVAGFRWYRKEDRPAVASLLLGLYDDSGLLQHVGVCGTFPLETRYELVEHLRPYRKNAAADIHGMEHQKTRGVRMVRIEKRCPKPVESRQRSFLGAAAIGACR